MALNGPLNKANCGPEQCGGRFRVTADASESSSTEAMYPENSPYTTRVCMEVMSGRVADIQRRLCPPVVPAKNRWTVNLTVLENTANI